LKINNSKLFFLAFALGAILSVPSASAQKKSGKKKLRQASDSSSAAARTRTRRVVTKSPVESAPSASASDQLPISHIVQSPNENSTKPAVTKTGAGEEPGDAIGTDATESPSGQSGEKPTGGEPLPPATAIKGTTTNPDSLSLRDQIDSTTSGSERIRLQLKLSEQLLAAGKNLEATKELLAIINADAFYPQGYYNAGNALARLGNSAEAINAYRKAIDQRKGNYSRALNNLGVVLLREGRWDEAHDALLSALKLESFRYAEASYNLGRLYSARGETDMATREWRRTLKIDPEHRAAAQALSLGASQPGVVVVKPEASAKAEGFKNNIHKVPERGMANVDATPRAGKSPSSPVLATAKALVIDPISYDLLQRARNLRERGKLDEAVENYQRVISRSNGYFPPANLELSYALLTLNKDDEAFANLLQIASRDGAQYPIAYYHLARLYELKGNLAQAEESFALAAAAYKSKNNSFLLDLSRIRERQGDFKGALTAMEEYVAAMEQQSQKPTWADESLSLLRKKANSEPK
jgi:tetratricopeptide (TPR) repeat protein